MARILVTGTLRVALGAKPVTRGARALRACRQRKPRAAAFGCRVHDRSPAATRDGLVRNEDARRTFTAPMTTPQPAGEHTLVRAIGVSGLAATTFNIMIGGGIFVLPAVAAAALGARAPLAYLVCALAMSLVLICFAESGSRVSLTGGPYAYVTLAFGPFAGFLSGVLLWVMAVFAVAAVASALAGSSAVLWPALAQPIPRALLLVAVIGLVTVINVRGVRGGARLVEWLAVVKLLPLFLFVIAGAVVAHAALSPAAPQAGGDLGRTVVVLIFAFAGSESALVPSGEVRDPSRTVPRALGIAMLTVMLLYIAVQVVAQRVLGVSALAAATDAPLSAAA